MSGRGFDRGKRHERDNRSRGRGGGRGNYQQAQSNQNNESSTGKKESLRSIDDLLNMLKRKINKTHPSDVEMVTMLENLHCGKEDILPNYAVPELFTAVKPRKLLNIENGLIKVNATGRNAEQQEELQAELDAEYETLARQYHEDLDKQKQSEEERNIAIKKNKVIESKRKSHIHAICIAIVDIVSSNDKSLYERLQLVSGAKNTMLPTGYVDKYGFMHADCVKLIVELKKLMEKSSFRDQEELDAEKKQTWIEEITSVKQLKSERIEAYILRLKELVRRGIEIYKTRENLFQNYQNESYLSKKFINGCSETQVVEAFNNERLKQVSGETYLKTLDEAYLFMQRATAYVNENVKKQVKVDTPVPMYHAKVGRGRESDEFEDKSNWVVYCRYCDGKGHVKRDCKTYAEHKEKNCINEEWVNRPKAMWRCDWCCIRGHVIRDCIHKQNGRPQGDYNRNNDEKRKMKQSANAIKIDAGFMMLADEQREAVKIIEVVEYCDEEAGVSDTSRAVPECSQGEIKSEQFNELSSDTVCVEEVECKDDSVRVEVRSNGKEVEHIVTIVNHALPQTIKNAIEYVYQAERVIVESKDLVILDTGATVSIFCNESYLTDVCEEEEPMFISGITKEKIQTKRAGKCNQLYGIKAYVIPTLHINIVSFRDLDIIKYIERCEAGFLSGETYWASVDKLYMWSNACDTRKLKHEAYTTNVQKRLELENRSATNKEKKLIQLEEIMGKWGVSPSMMKKIIKNQVIRGLQFEIKEVDELIQKYGLTIEYMASRAKMTKPVRKLVLFDSPSEKRTTLFCDLFKIYEQWFMLGVASVTKVYVMCPTRGKYGLELDAALRECVHGIYRMGGYAVSMIYFDGEKAVKESVEVEYNGIKTPITKLYGTHIPQVEVGVRVVKERVWHRHALIVFGLASCLVEHLCRCMVRFVNASPREYVDERDGTVKIMSPREYATGNAVTFNQVKYSFGDLVGWTVVNDRGVDAVKAGIVLFPSLDSDESYYILSLDSKKLNENAVVKTGRVQPLAWTADYKSKVESLGDLVPREKFKQSEFEELDADAVEAIHHLEVERDMYVDMVMNEEVKCIQQVMVGNKVMDNMSLKQAKELFPEQVCRESMLKEFKGYLDTESIEPTDEQGLRGLIRSYGFFKAKIDAKSGELITLKYRHVANGAEKKKNGFYDRFDRDFKGYTPAWNNTAAFLAINAAKGRHFVLLDVKQAYLKTENQLGHHMVFNRDEAKVLVELRPDWAKHIRSNGELIVKIKKSIYGLKESGRLWYEEFMRRAVQFPGVTINKVDPCFLKSDDVEACVYVDDTLVTGSLEHIAAFKTHMAEAFGELTCSEVDEFAYLGMHIKIVDKRVELRSDVYISKLIEDNKTNISNEYTTPCDRDMFKVPRQSPDSNIVESSEIREWYHSTVACLLYVAMRVRTDILLAVVYLATKVHNTLVGDVNKLKRVLGYLKKYPRRFMVLKVEDPSKLVLRCYADASYAIYEDGRKSQTGIFVTLGIGCIIARSVKQKLVAVSSTEAEITALSTMVRMVLGMVQFLVEQGFKAEDIGVILFEDNTSAIEMIKTGRPISEGTKHIDIHKYFVKQHIEPEGRFKLVFCKTGEQVANSYTKPMAVLKEFLRFLVDVGMRDVDESGQLVSITLIHDQEHGGLCEFKIVISDIKNIYTVHLLMSDLGSVFRIPVNLNQTVDNVKVESKRGEDVQSVDNKDKVKDECLHIALSDKGVGPGEPEPGDKELHASTFSESYFSRDSKEKAIELEACISSEIKRDK